MAKFKVEEIAEIVGGILSKVEDAEVSMFAPPLIDYEATLELAFEEEEIENLVKTKAKAADDDEEFDW